MLNIKKNKKKNNKIVKNQEFEISQIFTQPGQRFFLGLRMNFEEQFSYVLSEELSFEVFSPLWPDVNENEKNGKIQKCKILKYIYYLEIW